MVREFMHSKKMFTLTKCCTLIYSSDATALVEWESRHKEHN